MTVWQCAIVLYFFGWRVVADAHYKEPNKYFIG